MDDHFPVITVSRVQVYPRPAIRVAWYWLYECEGPEGRRFNNRSLVELKRVLKRRYPDAVVETEWS